MTVTMKPVRRKRYRIEHKRKGVFEAIFLRKEPSGLHAVIDPDAPPIKKPKTIPCPTCGTDVEETIQTRAEGFQCPPCLKADKEFYVFAIDTSDGSGSEWLRRGKGAQSTESGLRPSLITSIETVTGG